MSFDLYFAGSHTYAGDKILMERGACKLYSQLNDRTRGQMWLDYAKQNKDAKVFVDSGAFSAWSKGKIIDVDDYIKYINENTNELELFASVDNIPGELTRTPTHEEVKKSPILSWQNYLYMRERVKEKDKLLPVFHIGEDFKHLQNMLETKLDGKYIPYIALGGTVGLTANVKDNWYNTCFKVIRQSTNPNVKIHAFGMTSLNILEKYPFTSADSTSWIMTAANGNIYTPYGTVCVSKVSQDRPNHITKLPKSVQHNIRKFIEQYGVTVDECMEEYIGRILVNINYLQDWAENYEYKGTNKYQKRLF